MHIHYNDNVVQDSDTYHSLWSDSVKFNLGCTLAVQCTNMHNWLMQNVIAFFFAQDFRLHWLSMESKFPDMSTVLISESLAI